MNKEQLKKLEVDLWRAADSLCANSDLKASEYSTPVPGLIFLKFSDNMNLETAVGRAGVDCWRRVWVGSTTQL